MRRSKGFSLIELLIVVAIILIIAAIAIPNLLRARMAANESSAVSSIRTINTAETTYQSTYQAGYSTDLLSLGNSSSGTCSAPTSTQACLIDYSLAGATATTSPKSGYYFAYAAANNNTSYTVGGSAAKFNQTGVRDFCSNEDAVLHQQVPGSQSTPTTTSTTCAGWSALQ